MDEYINREAFKQKLIGKGFFPAIVQRALEEMPREDVVAVVRCKDCIFYKANSCFNRQWDFESSTEIPLVRENDFCSYGERKG